MKNIYFKADRFLWEIYRVAWLLVSMLAVYILYIAYEFNRYPSSMLFRISLLPQMTEHLLVSLIILLGVGALFEYLCRFD